MKVEEAIKSLNYAEADFIGTKYAEAFPVAISALEKQMPKAITHEATLYKCCTCPNCKNVVDKFEKWGENTVRITYNYCHFCGQKLDWSDHSTEKGGAE
jgi:hypothetical protein